MNAGIDITLRDGQDRIAGEGITADNGIFTFTELSPGDYTVWVDPPPGYSLPIEHPAPVSLTPNALARVEMGLTTHLQYLPSLLHP